MSLLAAGERAAVTAKARVYRGRLLLPDDYFRLLELETVGEIAAYLAKTEAYGRYLTMNSPEILHRGELEGIITSVPLLEGLPFCGYISPERSSLVHAWGERFDVDIIKRVLRIITTGVGSREALKKRVGSIPITVVDEDKLLAAETLRDLLGSLEGYPLHPILDQPIKRAEKEGGSLFQVRMAMDTFFLTRILSRGTRLPGSEGRGIRRLFGARADVINLYWIYRSRRFFALSPEEALALTLPVRHKLNFAALGAIAFAPDVPSMVKLLREGPYGEAFRFSKAVDTPEAEEMALEHGLYRVLWQISQEIFRSGASGVHVLFAYLTLRELEVKDLFTIIEDVRYRFDRKKARHFLIHPAVSFSDEGKEAAPWQ